MTDRRFRPGLWASLSCLIVFCILVTLGVWQLQRLEWKQGLIDDLRARSEAPPLTELPRPPHDLAALSYRSVRLTGQYLEGREFLFPGRSYQGMTGEELAAPFVTEKGRGVIVSRGWLPPQRLDPATRTGEAAEGPITIEGILRPGGWSGTESFRPVNDPEKNRWLYYDLEAMTAAAGLEDPETELYVSLKRQAGDESLPLPLPPAITLANNHLEYALTWFALSGGLIGIYLLFGFARGRETAGKQ